MFFRPALNSTLATFCITVSAHLRANIIGNLNGASELLNKNDFKLMMSKSFVTLALRLVRVFDRCISENFEWRSFANTEHIMRLEWEHSNQSLSPVLLHACRYRAGGFVAHSALSLVLVHVCAAARDIFRKKQFGALVEYIKALAHNSSTFLGKMTVIFIEPAFSCMHMYNFIIFDREKYTGLVGMALSRIPCALFFSPEGRYRAHREKKREKKCNISSRCDSDR
jgi:hypothetical protein